jgi:hypothetical protein
MADDPAKLWLPQAQGAVYEWATLHEPKRLELLRVTGAMNNTNTYSAIGEEAKRAFDEVGERLLSRVRDLLTRCDDFDQIGTPEEVATLLIGPLERTAREGIPDARQVAQSRGFTNIALLEGPLAQAKQQLQKSAALLRAQLQTEVQLRRQQIDQAKLSASKRTKTECVKLTYYLVRIAAVLIPAVFVAIDYFSDSVNLLGWLWHLLGSDAGAPTTRY